MVTLEEFFGEEDVFFVYGNERLSADDFELEFEGKLIDCYYRYSVILFLGTSDNFNISIRVGA